MKTERVKVDGPFFDTYISYCTCGWRSNLLSNADLGWSLGYEHIKEMHPGQKRNNAWVNVNRRERRATLRTKV